MNHWIIRVRGASPSDWQQKDKTTGQWKKVNEKCLRNDRIKQVDIFWRSPGGQPQYLSLDLRDKFEIHFASRYETLKVKPPKWKKGK